MHEVRFTDEHLGTCVLQFDGRVVEVFFEQGTSTRFHVLMLTIDVRGPDRKDRYVVDLAPRERGHGAVRLVVTPDVYAALAPVIAEVGASLQAAG